MEMLFETKEMLLINYT